MNVGAEDDPLLDDEKRVAEKKAIFAEYKRWTKGERGMQNLFRVQTTAEGDLQVESVAGDSAPFQQWLRDLWRTAERDGYFVIGSSDAARVSFTICAPSERAVAVEPVPLSQRQIAYLEEGKEKDMALEKLKSWRYYIVFVFTCYACVAAICFLATNQYRLLAKQFEPITMAVFLLSCATTGFYFVRTNSITSMQIIEYSSVKAMATVVWSLSMLVGATLRKSVEEA